MWTLYIITTTGRKVPHWEDTTRAKCRIILKGMTIPSGVRTVIERTT